MAYEGMKELTRGAKNWEDIDHLYAVSDRLEHVCAVLEFIKDFAEQIRTDDESYSICRKGLFGLYMIMGFVQDQLDDCGLYVREYCSEREDNSPKDKRSDSHGQK